QYVRGDSAVRDGTHGLEEEEPAHSHDRAGAGIFVGPAAYRELMRELAYILIALVVVQRLAELVYAERNTKALLARGAVEVGRAHYPLIVLLHAGWLIAIVALLPHDPPANLVLLAI